MFRYEIPLYSSYIMVRLHLLRILMMQQGAIVISSRDRIHKVFEIFQNLKQFFSKRNRRKKNNKIDIKII